MMDGYTSMHIAVLTFHCFIVNTFKIFLNRTEFPDQLRIVIDVAIKLGCDSTVYMISDLFFITLL